MKILRHTLFITAIISLVPAFAQTDKITDSPASEPRMMRGTDAVIAPPKAGGVVPGTAAGLKFEDAPLADVVHVVMREIAKVDYLIHPPITGSVTLSTQGNVSADDAMFLLENALQANGFLMARDARGTYHIGRPEVIKGIVPAVRQAVKNTPLPPGFGAVIFALKYVGAGEMASILRPLAPPDAIVRVDTVRNLIVMAGSRTQAEGWLDLVATFDVDLLKGMSMGVFPLKYITSKEIDLALRVLGSAASGAAGPVAATAPATPGAATAATLLGGTASAIPPNAPFYGALRVFPMERLNSVLVVTPRAAYLDEARQWIEKLDRPGTNSGETQLFVYPVQNGSAAHLANVLNGLFGGGTTAPAPTTAANSGVAPALTQASGATTGASGTPPVLAAKAGQSTVDGSGITALTLTSGLRVIADEINNAVLVFSSAGEYRKVEATLKRLDVPPTQVMIEASIIEVTLTDDLQYGLQWIFSDNARNGLAGTGVLSTAANALGGTVLGATPAGFSYTLSNSLGNVRAVINALAEKSLVKVISSPSLMVLNNHTASIVVGNQQPVRVGETVTAGGNITTNIQYKDTGVSLSVTPSVNAGNMVTMQLNQTVSDVGAVDAATGQRSFLQRQIGSKVAVRSGETLVLGGLIRDNTANGKSGLPLLQDIPLFGTLFGANTTNTNRTELLVVITPRVLRSDQDLRETAASMRDKMTGLEWARPTPAQTPPTTSPASAPDSR